MIDDYTTIVGVDAKHLRQLALVWPTWKRHKPSLLDRRMVVFYDWKQVRWEQIRIAVDHPDLAIRPWPPRDITYVGGNECKWDDPQRHKMLAGFVHVPARIVTTPYWLKLDTDSVAVGNDDWIDPRWMTGGNAIVAHPWSFTKPPGQMAELDVWVESNGVEDRLNGGDPLNLWPEPEASLLGHKRIISWCGFFDTAFGRHCSELAEDTCGPCQIPVPSQDGFMWYVAKRMKLGIVRASMKKLGWEHWCTMRNVENAVRRAMNG